MTDTIDDLLERPVVTRRPLRAPDPLFQPLSSTVRYPPGPVPDVQDAVPPPVREPVPWQWPWQGTQWPWQGQQWPWQSRQTPWQGRRIVLPTWQRSRVAAGLLGVFFGGLGLHRMYLGYWRRGLSMLAITVVAGFFTLGLAALVMALCGFVEGLLYLSMRRGRFARDARGRPLRG
ncbi:TM2 domain-containing protein [Cellulomonas sp. P5_C6]